MKSADETLTAWKALVQYFGIAPLHNQVDNHIQLHSQIVHMRGRTEYNGQEVPDNVQDPRFEEAASGRIRPDDWRYHVGENVTRFWHTFSPMQQAMIASDAQRRADAADWNID